MSAGCLGRPDYAGTSKSLALSGPRHFEYPSQGRFALREGKKRKGPASSGALVAAWPGGGKDRRTKGRRKRCVAQKGAPSPNDGPKILIPFRTPTKRSACPASHPPAGPGLPCDHSPGNAGPFRFFPSRSANRPGAAAQLLRRPPPRRFSPPSPPPVRRSSTCRAACSPPRRRS